MNWNHIFAKRDISRGGDNFLFLLMIIMISDFMLSLILLFLSISFKTGMLQGQKEWRAIKKASRLFVVHKYCRIWKRDSSSRKRKRERERVTWYSDSAFCWWGLRSFSKKGEEFREKLFFSFLSLSLLHRVSDSHMLNLSIAQEYFHGDIQSLMTFSLSEVNSSNTSIRSSETLFSKEK